MTHAHPRWTWLSTRAALAVLLALGACSGDDASGDAGSTSSDPQTTGTTGIQETSASSTAVETGVDTAADTGTVDDTGGVCTDVIPAVVTDIDETLTLSDAEFFMQIQDGTYDPVEREAASELINAYADLGYRIIYLTARAETVQIMVTDETAREATERWLLEHDFPLDPQTTQVHLSPTFVVGESARAFKAGVLMDLQAQGYVFEYAYGNADSDIAAYDDAMIPKDVTFIIGELAGAEGTVAIEGEGWADHLDTHLPSVPAVCEAA